MRQRMDSFRQSYITSGKSGQSQSLVIESRLTNVEEADDQIIMHSAYEIDNGSQQLLVISNDSDTVLSLFCYMPTFMSKEHR